MNQLMNLRQSLRSAASPIKAQIYQRFFKTGPGDYGEGDIFLGITVPEQRKIAKQFYNLSLDDIQQLLNSKIHEERFTALVILTRQFTSVGAIHEFPTQRHSRQKQIFNFYLKNTKRINNWDLVDTSAPQIVGGYLLNNVGVQNFEPLPILQQLAKSKDLWERRVAVLATFAFIRAGNFTPTLFLTKILLADQHDLIHKAVGWMLREVGKRSPITLKNFLDKYCLKMPRTMLRYAIEKLSPTERQKYLKK